VSNLKWAPISIVREIVWAANRMGNRIRNRTAPKKPCRTRMLLHAVYFTNEDNLFCREVHNVISLFACHENEIDQSQMTLQTYIIFPGFSGALSIGLSTAQFLVFPFHLAVDPYLQEKVWVVDLKIFLNDDLKNNSAFLPSFLPRRVLCCCGGI
jgi:hypothetical protein